MIVLGLDPGIAKFGYGVLSREHGVVSYVDAGVIKTPSSDSTAVRLAALEAELSLVFQKHKISHVVIERLIPGPHRNLGVVSEARGVALLLIGQHKLPYSERSPKTVKLLITRHGAATKMQMRLTMQRLLQMEALPLPDAADALALALLG